MSCITENTIVIRPEAEPVLLSDIEKVGDIYRVSDLKCKFRNNEYVAYIFDCNGDQPWEVADAGTLDLDFEKDVIGTETVYPDGGRWTQILDTKTGYWEDSDKKLSTIMKQKLTPEEFEAYKKGTAYTYQN